MAFDPLGQPARDVSPSSEEDRFSPVENDRSPERTPLSLPSFAALVRADWETYRWSRRAAGVDDRLVESAMRRRGQYSATELAAIQRVGAKPVYAQITPAKCLLATSLLAALYLGPERPWRLQPTPEPQLPETRAGAETARLLGAALADEVAARELAARNDPTGTVRPASTDEILARARELAQIADHSLQQKAWKEARRMMNAVDDVLVEGGFYKALGEFLHDFTTYPYAVLRGPVMRIVHVPDWDAEGKPVVTPKARLTWERVDPSLVWWTPGSTSTNDAVFIELMPFLASDLEAFIGVPGFDENSLRIVIERYSETGWRADQSTGTSGSLRGVANAGRPGNETFERRGPVNLIDVLAWSGRVSGATLGRWRDIQLREPIDPGMTYYVQAWVVNDLLIYLDVTSDPLAAPVYAVASWDWQPGSLVGRSLPEMLSDVQDAANAVMRALVSNVAIASGPQVVVDVDRLATQDATPKLSPWKIWQVVNDPVAGGQAPVSFFQPPMNAGELLTIYQQLQSMADEVSGLPRFMGGSGRIGTLGRTASGISMMMERASQVVRTLAMTIDTNILEPNIERVFAWVRQQRPDLTGDARVVVLGATKLAEDDIKRQKVLELLALTSNPVDVQLLGLEGRLGLLKTLAQSIGLPEELLVPTVEQLRQAQAAAQAGQIGPSGSLPAGPARAETPAAPAPPTGRSAVDVAVG